MSSLKMWVWLSSKLDLKPVTRYKLLSAFDDPEGVFLADERALSEKVKLTDIERQLILDKSLSEADRILETCHAEGISILTIKDAAYPERLRNIYDPPVVLYVKGRLPAVDEQAAIGVVGTRDATPYGVKMGRRIGFEITKGGGLVVTGLAEGVDSAAAEGALRAGGSCVGVLGCAIDRVYPVFNTALYRDVEAVGALVGEYPPGVEGNRRFFPERNRIISGLSVGVTVIEAPEKSGALITARLALDQGRELFVVPGNADAPGCVGSNSLISDGATLVMDGRQILSGFESRFPERLLGREKRSVSRSEIDAAPPAYPASTPVSAQIITPQKKEKPERTGAAFVKLRVPNERKTVDKAKKRGYIDLRDQLAGLSEIQLKIVSAIDEKSKHVDDIINQTQLDTGTVLSELTMLQLKGVVSQESGKRFSLNVLRRDR